ncbi:hypothetical protein HanPSC8_Chr03g0090971 [Helianthus annuus]|nr:hypothetical protein HanPSC8_Chr03g0090971 [Helianthus annuus]
MARLDCQSSQVSLDKPILSKCFECIVLKGKYLELEGKFDHTKKHHQSMVVDLTKCTEVNTALKKNEKEFKITIETLRKDVSELTKNVFRKQTAINNYINTLEETKKELVCAKCEYDTIKLKLDSYSNSRYVLDHITDVQKKKGDVKCIGYKACPPPVRHNYTKMPDDEDMPHFEPSVPLDFYEFTNGLGFTKGASSSQSQLDEVNGSKSEINQSPPIVEDCDSSDDELDEDKPKQSETVTKEENIPLKNHNLCDPSTKPFVTATVKSVESSSTSCESVKLALHVDWI